ncbi:MAG: serpin family protein [Bacteroidales bacterium]|nr:serpin family protein [Bacteroidales bacterium]
MKKLLIMTMLLGYYPVFGQNDVSFNSYINILNNEIYEQNIMFSPYSIKKVFDIYNLENGKEKISCNINNECLQEYNGAWFQENKKNIKIDYLNIAKELNVDFYFVDFMKEPENCANLISENINSAMNNELEIEFDKSLINKSTEKVFVNTLIFEDNWLNGFVKHLTKPNTFYGKISNNDDVDFMTCKGNFLFSEDDSNIMIVLPYKVSKFEMVVIMPKNGNSNICFEDAKKLYHNLEDYSVDLLFPKFEINSKCNLNEIAKNFGLEINTQTTKSVQNIKLSINEIGTKAQSVSSIVIYRSVSFNKSENIIINKPFFFFIHDRLKYEIIFAGKINQL